jgi:hypothetical protein
LYGRRPSRRPTQPKVFGVDKTTVASFALLDRPCGDIGKLLVNDVPVCTAAGGALDCVGALNRSSRAAVPLAK